MKFWQIFLLKSFDILFLLAIIWILKANAIPLLAALGAVKKMLTKVLGMFKSGSS
jgi:hypothetical protein